MNRLLTLVAAASFVALVAAPGIDAQVMRHSGGDGGELVILREVGVVAGPKEGTDNLEVLTLLPDAASPSGVSIERGDLLLMIGGKRIRDVAHLREVYEAAAVGETVKLGFRRGDERWTTATCSPSWSVASSCPRLTAKSSSAWRCPPTDERWPRMTSSRP